MFIKKRDEIMKTKITAKEAAILLDVGYSTFKRYVRTHKHRKLIVVYRRAHNNVRYCRESVLAFDEATKAKIS